jgi:predicted PurR-regulated permease PerM
VIFLIYGQSILIPFIFALLLWFTIRVFTSVSEKIPIYGRFVPTLLKKIISTILIFLVLYVLTQIVLSSFNNIFKSHHNYDDNINDIIQKINTQFNIDIQSYVKTQSSELNIGTVAESLFNAISNIVSSTLMILLFAVFIFIEELYLNNKLQQIFSKSPRKFKQLNDTLYKIEWSVARYLGIKTLISLLTGFLSYLIFIFIELDFAIFWAFLIFLLNFIPTVGSLLGTVFPSIFCLLQFGDFTIALSVLLVVGLIQIFIGNFLEPKWLGNSMNISPLFSIISLVFWGLIWGTTGMVISVPITVVLLIILSQFESTKSIAILLSEKGEINK